MVVLRFCMDLGHPEATKINGKMETAARNPFPSPADWQDPLDWPNKCLRTAKKRSKKADDNLWLENGTEGVSEFNVLSSFLFSVHTHTE